MPPDLRLCFETVTPAPPAGPMTKAQVVELVATLHRAELEKTMCGRRLISWVDDHV